MADRIEFNVLERLLDPLAERAYERVYFSYIELCDEIDALTAQLAEAQAEARRLRTVCKTINVWIGTEEALNWDLSFEPPWYHELHEAIAAEQRQEE